ncbi:MAG: protein-glutamate O-methyltransferase CheR [Sphingobium sp.]|jgi:chemotaxis protein methyltransferase CheR|nr:protein-glutamate O-methyltransferase CheR [Sphingobium sp.]MCP5399804.1 protein-glutamate O-methyltransferase CheR [Sphingomonas sp.]
MKDVTLTPPMRQLIELLESRTGQTLSESRVWRLETSLKPVLKSAGLKDSEELMDRIVSDPDGPLAVQTVDALVNNETSFFRDAHIFNMIGKDLLPQMMERLVADDRGKTLRIWCAGCSTGQEAYSLALLFRNLVDEKSGFRLQIVATDVSRSAIGRARSGLYPQMDVQRGLPINDLLRWFEPAGDDWQVHQSLRDMIEFRVDNLLDSRAMNGDYDMVFCRNVLLYFSPERKAQIFSRLARQCRVGGYLLLGAGETVIGQTHDFTASRTFRGVYEHVDASDFGANI